MRRNNGSVSAKGGEEASLHLMLEGVHCGGCVAKIERALAQEDGVHKARVNLTLRRLAVTYDPAVVDADALVAAVEKLGYGARPYDPQALGRSDDKEAAFLLTCLGVAGFASMNVMLISVALWAGGEMHASTRALLQAFSALITLPAVAYAGQPFFISAWKALRHGQTNMDVPISLAVLLTSGISTYDMFARYGETYFESAVMLLFFLLCGRYLDQRARGKSRSAAEQLLNLQQVTARLVEKGGKVREVSAEDLKTGQVVLVARGERFPADGVVVDGKTQVDASLLTGESLPQAAGVGDAVMAGCINIEAAVRVRVTAGGKETQLAAVARLVASATEAKNAYTRLADRVARWYAPVVHTLALATFVVWYGGGLADLHTALLHAAAVLIVTCPCALALAVPAVQVALVTRLLKLGVLLTSADALERMAGVTRVVFDKTGTLTTGILRWVNGGDKAARRLAARMGMASRHPLALAMVQEAPDVAPLENVREVAGKGLEATVDGKKVRLGSAAFCGVKDDRAALPAGHTALWLAVAGKPAVRFELADMIRDDAARTVRDFKSAGLAVAMFSGDRAETAAAVAKMVGIDDAHGQMTPAAKHDALQAMATAGGKVLMCGDGINDAPSLAAAQVGLTFGRAADIAKTGADVVLQNDKLHDAVVVWRLSRLARRAVVMNFGLSFSYNVVTVPLAMLGYMSPMWAALAMSASSLMVVGNALRLTYGGRKVQAL